MERGRNMPKRVHYLNKFEHRPCKAVLRALGQFHAAFRYAPVGFIRVNPADLDAAKVDGRPVVADEHVPAGQVVVEADE